MIYNLTSRKHNIGEGHINLRNVEADLILVSL